MTWDSVKIPLRLGDRLPTFRTLGVRWRVPLAGMTRALIAPATPSTQHSPARATRRRHGTNGTNRRPGNQPGPGVGTRHRLPSGNARPAQITGVRPCASGSRLPPTRGPGSLRRRRRSREARRVRAPGTSRLRGPGMSCLPRPGVRRRTCGGHRGGSHFPRRPGSLTSPAPLAGETGASRPPTPRSCSARASSP